MSWADFIRAKRFDDSRPKRGPRNKYPVKDEQDLAKVLCELGQSRLANKMNQLAKAVKEIS